MKLNQRFNLLFAAAFLTAAPWAGAQDPAPAAEARTIPVSDTASLLQALEQVKGTQQGGDYVDIAPPPTQGAAR